MNYAREFRGLCALPLGPLSSDVHRITRLKTDPFAQFASRLVTFAAGIWNSF